MPCDFLLAAAMVLSQHANPAPPAWSALPAPPSVVLPAAPSAATAKTPEPVAPEQLTAFSTDRATLEWSADDWRLVSDGVTVKDFGRRESDARQALRLIRELRLDQRGTIGGSAPSLEYWLSDGQAPPRPPFRMRVTPIDPACLRVERSEDQWVVRDDRRVLFGFGRQQAAAQQALAVVRKYGFTQVGAVGQGAPSMIVFFSDPEAAAFANGPIVPPASGDSPPSPAVRPAAASAFLAPAVAPLREVAPAKNATSVASQTAGRTPFDWRRVQLVHENGDWKMAAGSCVLADFGSDEHAARLGLSAVQFYRFTEKCEIGGPSGQFTYFLSAGQPGRGTLFGVDSQGFQADRLQVRQVNGRWAVCTGDRPLVDTGSSQDAANQVLEMIRRQQCDRLCRLGTEEGKGMTFLVRSR